MELCVLGQSSFQGMICFQARNGKVHRGRLQIIQPDHSTSKARHNELTYYQQKN